jgi:hypothetical protein
MAASGNQDLLPWGWKESYVAALVEADKKRMPRRIADAECLIINRAKTLLSASGDNIQEQEALDDALYALRALKVCLEINGGYAEPEPQKPRDTVGSAMRKTPYGNAVLPVSNLLN